MQSGFSRVVVGPGGAASRRDGSGDGCFTNRAANLRASKLC